MKRLLAILFLTLLLAACAPAPTAAPTLAASATPEPLPTLAPTPTPIPVILQPTDYLLTPADLPIELFKSFTNIYREADGSITSSIFYFNMGVGRLTNAITIADQAYTAVPDGPADVTPIENPLLGPNARAYESERLTTYVFYKGNALIKIQSELTLDVLVGLGKLIEARLPDRIEPAPITFPEQLDEAAFAQTFKTINLAKQEPGKEALTPTSTFSKTDMLCLAMDSIAEVEAPALAVYDPQEKVYVQKYVPEYDFNCLFLIGISHPGPYELRISAKDTLISILPFEIQ